MAPYNGLVTAGVNLYLITRGDALAALALAPGYHIARLWRSVCTKLKHSQSTAADTGGCSPNINLGSTPVPAHAVSLRKLVEVSTQPLPFPQRIVPPQRIASQERVDFRSPIQHILNVCARSEERRVGKECRSRWS